MLKIFNLKFDIIWIVLTKMDTLSNSSGIVVYQEWNVELDLSEVTYYF